MSWMRAREAAVKLPGILTGRLAYRFDHIPMSPPRLTLRKRMNLILAGVDMVGGSERLLSLPPTVQIEPASVCNLRCPLCPTGANSNGRRAGLMSRAMFDRIMAELGDVLVGAVLYSWGEPFLNPLMPYMIRECSRRGIATVTSTNGHYLQRLEEALEVVDAGLRGLVIAIDGSTQEIYQKYRQGGDVDKVKNCLRMIGRAKAIRKSPFPYTNMRVVVTQANQDDLTNLEQLAREVGVNLYSLKSVGCLTDSEKYEQYDPEQAELRRYSYRNGRRVHRKPRRCPYPFRQPTIFWDGAVVGCEFDYGLEHVWGNLGRQSFQSIWNSAQARALRRSIRQGEGQPTFCLNCPYRDRTRESCVIRRKELRSQSSGMGNTS